MRFISNLIDFGMDPQQAIDSPRSIPDSGELQLETGYSSAVAAELAAMGHKVTRRAMPLGGAQSTTIDELAGVLVGASDGRKDGCALGY